MLKTLIDDMAFRIKHKQLASLLIKEKYGMELGY